MDDTKLALKHSYLSTFDRILIPRSSLKLNCQKIQLAWCKFVILAKRCIIYYIYHICIKKVTLIWTTWHI